MILTFTHIWLLIDKPMWICAGNGSTIHD